MSLQKSLRIVFLIAPFTLVLLPLTAVRAQDGGIDAPVQQLSVEVLAVYPHDPAAFTQGLLYYDGFLYESTGQRGASTLRQIDPTTGEVLKQVNLEEQYFGEGLAKVGDRLIQLTWVEQVAFVYNFETFERLGSFAYEGEGWGLCYDDRYLFMSDGSPYLSIRDAETFDLIFKGRVTVGGASLQNGLLNELECVGDYIYGNAWKTDVILKIDKMNGQVVGIIDASTLLTPEERETLADSAVLNGIAYNPETETFFITGKYWPKLFEVRFIESASPTTPAGG